MSIPGMAISKVLRKELHIYAKDNRTPHHAKITGNTYVP